MKSNLDISVPFLATDIKQLLALEFVNCSCVEAVIFNRRDLEEDYWAITWDNIKKACDLYGSNNVVFHFPVNDSDYTDDSYVHNKLKEAYKRAVDLNISGIVVHSNRIRKIWDWSHINLKEERKRVVESLMRVTSSCSAPKGFWLGLENMPVMDNYGKEIDPLFSFPNDFDLLKTTNIGITWDICHYSNTLANMNEVYKGRQKREYYPNIQNAQLDDFSRLNDKIVHWHFSAFSGVANPDTRQQCKEGVLPSESTFGEDLYKRVLFLVDNLSLSKRKLTLEIQEDDYLQRNNVRKMIEWVENQF